MQIEALTDVTTADEAGGKAGASRGASAMPRAILFPVWIVTRGEIADGCPDEDQGVAEV